MDAIFEEPVSIYLCLVLAAVAVLIEAALPTFGVAGFISLFLAAVASIALVDQRLEWWPLLLPTVGVGVWGVSLVFKRRSALGQIMAFTLFTSGSLLFALLAEDLPTGVVGLTAGLGLAWTHPRLFSATYRLMHAPPEVGMESFVGQSGVVVEWNGDSGTIKLGGGYWSASGQSDLEAGQHVTVLNHEGMHFMIQRSS